MNAAGSKALWWVKRDFRLSDNEALVRAIDQYDDVLALFIIEPSLCQAAESSTLHYYAWKQAATELASELRKRGGQLLIRVGESVDALRDVHAAYRFDAVFSHEETGTLLTYQRDKHVSQWLQEKTIVWKEFVQNGVVRALRSRDDRNAIVKSRLFETPCFNAPTRILCSSQLQSDDWPSFEAISGKSVDERIQFDRLQRVSESAAQLTLNSFLHNRAYGYSGGISSPNSAFRSGSRLSTHLAWGTISLRSVFHALHEKQRKLSGFNDENSQRWRKSLSAFEARLHWHDHFIQRLESAPDMELHALNPAYQALEYGACEEILTAWCTGQTGIPMVDASIRCLAATGFLNFRMRAMLVTTACFGLAQSWQSILYPLARLFLDYEPGIHISQVQMQAGVVGINTLRVYSPYKQLVDQDPRCDFVKRWIPELREFSSEDIHAYDSRTLGDYVEPITDLSENAKVMKARVYAIKQSDEGKVAAKAVLGKHGSRKPAAKKRRLSGASKDSSLAKQQMTLDFD